MDDLINSFKFTGTHCPKDAFTKLKENIKLCEEALFSNTRKLEDVAITLRNVNTNYCNEFTIDPTDYQKFQIEDYLEYIRFLNFLMHKYWDSVKNDSYNPKNEIEISLRIYREITEGLDHGYKVFCKSSDNPYFLMENKINDYNKDLISNIQMCENGMRNPDIALEVAKKVMEINTMYTRYLPPNKELQDILTYYWNVVDDDGTPYAQIQISYRFYRKILELGTYN